MDSRMWKFAGLGVLIGAALTIAFVAVWLARRQVLVTSVNIDGYVQHGNEHCQVIPAGNAFTITVPQIEGTITKFFLTSVTEYDGALTVCGYYEAEK